MKKRHIFMKKYSGKMGVKGKRLLRPADAGLAMTIV
jgi:hypothetical protein